MIRRLLQANLRNDAQVIEEVKGYSANIAEARSRFHRKHLSVSLVNDLNRGVYQPLAARIALCSVNRCLNFGS